MGLAAGAVRDNLRGLWLTVLVHPLEQFDDCGCGTVNLIVKDADYYLLNRFNVHDPRQLTRACLGGKKINPRHWFRVPRSAAGRDIQGPPLYPCGFCLREEVGWHWNGELMPDR